jgi:hypothetical protein
MRSQFPPNWGSGGTVQAGAFGKRRQQTNNKENGSHTKKRILPIPYSTPALSNGAIGLFNNFDRSHSATPELLTPDS